MVRAERNSVLVCESFVLGEAAAPSLQHRESLPTVRLLLDTVNSAMLDTPSRIIHHKCLRGERCGFRYGYVRRRVEFERSWFEPRRSAPSC
jgi:hypothetical protein